MMKSEFIERTGFEPTEAEYRELKQSTWDATSAKTSSARHGKSKVAFRD